MRNDKTNSIYNPCEQCPHRANLFRCPFSKRQNCAQYVFSQYLYIVENGGFGVPDEVLVEILRKRGWHGELRQQSVVRV